ncbi:UNVERIFIED_CONTAM: Cinnamoyl-CoA reductase 2 [Sesamum radiatum]|uniref:Cinnamoyl-CoA reductase 2 n=1 Tax=Sesamum radiatum TaxID=300843 RepID=A0AAW2RZ94_SESRA
MVSENPSGTRVHDHPPLHIPRLRPFSPLFPTGRYQPTVSLIVHHVNLLDAAAVDKAVEGCAGGGVFHVASPCTLEDPVDPQTELLEPAVKGTLNVLAAAKKFGVRRVVLTSSISAMVPNPGWPTGEVFDESSWTDLDYCKSRQLCRLATAASGVERYTGVPLAGGCACKDVATAQILLFETPTASGRYLCTNGIYQFGDFARKSSNSFPSFPFTVEKFMQRHTCRCHDLQLEGRRTMSPRTRFYECRNMDSIISQITFPSIKGASPSKRCNVPKMRSSPSTCGRSWSISEDSLRRYVFHASENCIQELLSASDTNRAESFTLNDGWKVVAMENGVEISKRRSGSLHTFRSRRVLKSVSPQQFMTVANAIDAAKQWDADLVEANYIKDLEENLSIIRLRFGEKSKPLFRNREFIVYERRETMDDGTLVVAVASLPKEIAAGLHPKQNNSIRGLLLQSGWVVEKLEDDSCMVTYIAQLDPAGWLPKCFVNRFNTKLVMIIENLKKQVLSCPTTAAT